MTLSSLLIRASRSGSIVLLSLFVLGDCNEGTGPVNQTELTEFAASYAAAWSSQDPRKLASHYAENGSLQVNDGEPSVGRAAIAAKAGEFMDAFPDMVVRMDSASLEDEGIAVFRWIWTGTNTGPGGTGKPVHLTGFEEWTLSTDGLIVESKGHYDQAEYERQVSGESKGS